MSKIRKKKYYTFPGNFPPHALAQDFSLCSSATDSPALPQKDERGQVYDSAEEGLASFPIIAGEEKGTDHMAVVSRTFHNSTPNPYLMEVLCISIRGSCARCCTNP